MNQQIISALGGKPAYADDEGYYGTPPTKECQDNAIKFIGSLPKYYQEIINPSEHITPQAHGTIVIDWYYRKQFVSLEVGNTLVGFYSDFNDGINPQSPGKSPELIRDVIVNALNKLYNRNDK